MTEEPLANTHRLWADRLAADGGYVVVIPDFFLGEWFRVFECVLCVFVCCNVCDPSVQIRSCIQLQQVARRHAAIVCAIAGALP